jgi:uncharacterized membrane protein
MAARAAVTLAAVAVAELCRDLQSEVTPAVKPVAAAEQVLVVPQAGLAVAVGPQAKRLREAIAKLAAVAADGAPAAEILTQTQADKVAQAVPAVEQFS